MSRPRALVKGGCGFVGRHFVNALVQRGYHVDVVDNLSTGLHPSVWPGHLRVPGSSISFHHVDFRDYVKEATEAGELVLHLAAVVGGRLKIEGDPLAVATDLAIDATFFNWIVQLQHRPRKVIYFSSSAAYPTCLQTASKSQPLREDLIRFDESLGLPDMTYGWAKLTGEYLAQHAAASYGLNVVIYRPFSGYGEDQDLTYPFPSVVRRVGQRESPIVVWGSGQQVRDFIYIDDVVAAVFSSVDKLEPGEALNLGSGVGTSFRQLAEIAVATLGHQAEVVNDPSKPEGVFARVADCSRMFALYRPAFALEHGIQIVHEYQQRVGLVPLHGPATKVNTQWTRP
jgi:nucleoside-diphosphate-sugar epimerase